MKDLGEIGDQVIVKEFKVSNEHSGEVMTERKGTIISRYKEFERKDFNPQTLDFNYGKCLHAELYVILFDDGTVDRGYVREELTRNKEHIAHGAEHAR